MANLKPIFCGNFEYDAQPREIERLFERYGPLDRVDMKTGFAFVYMKDSRDGDDAIRALDGREFGYRRRRLRIEWAKGDGEVRRREDVRKKTTKPATTLFVVNFDVDRVRERDLERHFEPYGKLKRVQIKRNYAFVQYESIDQAEEALKATHGSRLSGDNRVLSVEYVAREADGRNNEADRGGGGYGGSDRGGRTRSRSPYRGRPRSRSPSYGRGSPVRRGRDSRSPAKAYSRSPVREYSRSPRRSDSRDRSLSR